MKFCNPVLITLGAGAFCSGPQCARASTHQLNSKERRLIDIPDTMPEGEDLDTVMNDYADYLAERCMCLVFSRFDGNGNGYLDQEELMEFFQDVSDSSDEAWEEDWVDGMAGLFSSVDIDGRGYPIWPFDDNCSKIHEDPQIMQFNGRIIHFHGVCDLLFYKNPDFDSGLGLECHVRTDRNISPHTGEEAAYISKAAVRVGYDTLEVTSDGSYSLNGIDNEGPLPTAVGGGTYVLSKKIAKRCFGPNFDKRCTDATVFRIEKVVGAFSPETAISYFVRDHILVSVYHGMVNVELNFVSGTVNGGVGLSGGAGGGKLARDGTSIIDDTNEFGKEWQVHPGDDGILFQVERAPVYPDACIMPVPSTTQDRRLRDKNDVILCEN